MIFRTFSWLNAHVIVHVFGWAETLSTSVARIYPMDNIHLRGSSMTEDVNFVSNSLCLKQLLRTISLVTPQRSLL